VRILLSIALMVLVAFLAIHGDHHAALAIAFVPSWVSTDSTMSAQNLMTPYTVGQNPSFLEGIEPSGMYVQGFDESLGIGQFIYAQASAAAGINAGNVCELTQTLFSSGASISLITSVQQWAGTANSGKTLCVALTTLTQFQFGWFQVYGASLVTTSAAVAVGAGAWWNALGVVQGTAVASKQMVNAQCVVASSASFGQAVFVTGTGNVTPALTATQAIYNINAPFAQSAIT
jgi:hypothetical protein